MKLRRLALAGSAALGFAASLCQAAAPVAPPAAPPAYGAPAYLVPAEPGCATCAAPAVVPAEVPAPGGLVGGASFYLLKPYLNNNAAAVTTTGIGTANPVVTTRDFSHDFEPAFAVWAGYQIEQGVGVRSRFFHFESDDSLGAATLGVPAAVTTSIAPPAGVSPVVGIPPRGFVSPGILLQNGVGADALDFANSIRVQSIDLEATCAGKVGALDLLLSGGGRYQQLQQGYRAVLVNAPVPGLREASFLDASNSFYGGGPTAALQGRFAVGESGLALYGLARGTLLIGQQRLNATFTENIVDPVLGDQVNVAANRSTYNSLLPVGELELGLEYGLAVAGSRAFARAAAVNQTYFDAGSATSRTGNLSLFGVQFSLGLNY